MDWHLEPMHLPTLPHSYTYKAETWVVPEYAITMGIDVGQSSLPQLLQLGFPAVAQ